MKKVNDLPVNDGKGLYDNCGLCDSLIQDCNSVIKSLCSGNYLQMCGLMVQMVQKISNLKEGIKTDMKSMSDKVEELKRMNDDLAAQVYNVPSDNGGDKS